MEVLMQNLTRDEFTTLLKKLEVVIIPVGSHEQHGPHLPLQHDWASALYIAEATAQRLYPTVLVAPPITIGLSPHHMQWRGTLTLKGETFVNLLVEICESLYRHGVKRVVILNGHGGNYNPDFTGGRVAPIDLAVIRARELGLKAMGVSYWHLIPPSFFHKVLSFDRNAGHAGEFETSVGLYIYPERVRRDKLGSAEEGTSGHLDAASAEKGRRIVEKAVKGMVEYLQGFVEDRIDGVQHSP